MEARRSLIFGTLSALVLCICASPARADPVASAFTSWQWGNPTPQGDGLSDVAFLGARGYAVGGHGAVLRSDDAGHTWTGTASGTLVNLTRLQELDPNTVIVGGDCTLRPSSDAGASFRRLYNSETGDRCGKRIISFWFFDAQSGFIEHEDGSIVLTRDGGRTTEVKARLPVPGEKLVYAPGDLHFLSRTTGLALMNGNAGGRIMRTSDGGSSWTEVAASAGALTRLSFASATVAYAVGWRHSLVQSTDEGRSWHSMPLALPSGAPSDFTDIACSGPSNCTIASGGSTLIHTADGGLTGSLFTAPDHMQGVAFTSAANAVAVADGGTTVLSSDGGATFPSQVSHGLHLEPLERTIRPGQSTRDAYIPGGRGEIAATNDGGVSWSLLRVPTSHGITDVAFPRRDIGYALDDSGRVFRSATGGLTWSTVASKVPTPAALLAPAASTVLLIGPMGVRRSTNGGRSFTRVRATVIVTHRRAPPSRVSVQRLRLMAGELVHGVVFAYGPHLLRSSDAGAHWTLIPTPPRSSFYEPVAFVSATTGYAVCGGLLLFTRDSGSHWREIDSLPIKEVGEGTEIYFSGVADGYAISNYPAEDGLFVFRTEDAGRTWIPEELQADVLLATPTVDYASAGGLFWTKTGGLLAKRSRLTLSVLAPPKITPKRLKQLGNRVRLSGRLEPASGGESVVIAWLQGHEWEFDRVAVGADGRFLLTVHAIYDTTHFIAQWSGNGVVSGAATPAVQLRVASR